MITLWVKDVPIFVSRSHLSRPKYKYRDKYVSAAVNIKLKVAIAW